MERRPNAPPPRAARLAAASLVTLGALFAAACDDVIISGGGPPDGACDGGCGPDLPANAPSITAVIPSRGPASQATPVTIKGHAFAAGAHVSFAGAAADDAKVAASDTIQATAPAHPGACGPVTVAVTNTDGKGASAALYRYVATSIGFAKGIDVTAGGRPGRFVLGDLDGDGKPDLVALDVDPTSGASSVVVARGNGNGTFAPPTSYPVGADGTDVALADVDKDGKLDVVVLLHGPNATGGAVGGLLNKGDGKLGAVKLGAPFGAAVHGAALATADFDGDGKPDVAVVTGPTAALVVATGVGDGTFQTVVSYPLGGASTYAGVVTGDFNRDNRPDVAVSGGAQPSIGVLLAIGPAAFAKLVSVATGGTSAFSLVGADFDADGKVDLATSDYGGTAVSVLRGGGDGTFQPWKAVATSAAEERLAVGDVNCDGWPDLLGVGVGMGSLLVGHGDGTFDGSRVVLGGVDGAAAAIADLDGDGRGDLCLSHIPPPDPKTATPVTALLNSSQ